MRKLILLFVVSILINCASTKREMYLDIREEIPSFIDHIRSVDTVYTVTGAVKIVKYRIK
jgi:hypothetical protein